MNNYLFFLLTSCAVVAFSGASHAADNVIINTEASTYTDWLKSIEGSYSAEELQRLQNGTMTQDELMQALSRSMSTEEQAAFLKEISGGSQFLDGQVSQLGNALTSSSSNIASQVQQMGISGASVDSLNNTISSINNSMNQLGNLSSEAQNYLGNIQQSALDSVSDVTGALTGNTSFAGDVGAQITGAMELMNNPQSLLTMGLGYIGWDQITNLSMGAAMDAVTDFMSAPTVGIPVMEGSFIASNAADKAAKAQTGELNNKVSDEKQKQADAVGSRPSAPAGEEAMQAADADTNPSLDSCPALMASYPRQSNKAYDFLKINYLDATPAIKHADAQKSMAAAVPYVESLLFLKKDDLTAEKQIEFQKKRDKYLADMVSDVLVFNIGVQQNLVEDAMSIPTAPTSGCNLIDDLNVSTMIMISTAKQLMADIALQIQLLEFEGIQRVANTDVVLLDKPEEKKENNQ